MILRILIDGAVLSAVAFCLSRFWRDRTDLVADREPAPAPRRPEIA